MSGWTAKKFWKNVTVEPAQNGFGLFLDGRPVKTPAKATMIVPTQAMAEAIAQEWRAVEEVVDPNKMPMTRSANAAIDKVARQFDDVAEMIGEYGGSDLLCYRAEGPDALCKRQAEGWDPLLDWVEKTVGAKLIVGSGLMPIAQDDHSVQLLKNEVRGQTAFQLTAIHDLVAITGSLVLGLAISRGHLSADSAWKLSRIDEDWQIEKWGDDEEASALAAHKYAALLHAERFHQIAS